MSTLVGTTTVWRVRVAEFWMSVMEMPCYGSDAHLPTRMFRGPRRHILSGVEREYDDEHIAWEPSDHMPPDARRMGLNRTVPDGALLEFAGHLDGSKAAAQGHRLGDAARLRDAGPGPRLAARRHGLDGPHPLRTGLRPLEP